MDVAAIDIQDLYDEFNFGHKDPQAVRVFLEFATGTWAKSPRFVLLVGDASFDPKDYLGFGDFDFVPTPQVETLFVETASDDWFADFNGDGIADISIGRLPARSAAEVQTLVEKTLAFEDAGDAEWKRRILLVADNNDDSHDFEAALESIDSYLPDSFSVDRISLGRQSLSAAREALFEKFSNGALLVDFVGHGSTEVWAGEGLLTSDDAALLANGTRLPFVVGATCLNGLFHDLFTECLGEAVLKAPDGGAVAFWASSTLTDLNDQMAVNEALLREILSGETVTIGEAVRRAKAATRNRDVRRSWILFGDPSLQLH
jgi:hypothetical protein